MARTKQTAQNPHYRQGKVARFGDNGTRPGTSGSQQNNSTNQTGSAAHSSGNSDESKTVNACASSDTAAKNAQQQTVLSVMGAFREELICAICADKFKQPKSLACSHTFCMQCLQNMMAQHDVDVDVECPTCRHVTDMDNHDGIIANLPTNLVAQNLVEKFECESKRMVDVMKNKCSLHGSEVLSLFCETCKEAICRECALYVHCKPKHEYVNLGDMVGKLKETSLIKMHQLNDKSGEFKTKFDEFERFHNDWIRGTNQAEFWVKKVASVVLEKIEKDKREKLALIKDKQEFQNMLFKNYGDYFNSLLKKIKEVIYSKADLDKIPDVEYLGMHETLVENVDHLLKQDLPYFDSEAWNYSVMFQSNDELINEKFSLGSVEINMNEGVMLKQGGTKQGVKRPRETTAKDGSGGATEEVGKKHAVETYRYCECKNNAVASTGQDKRVASHQSMENCDPSKNTGADVLNLCCVNNCQRGPCCGPTQKSPDIKQSIATKETGNRTKCVGEAGCHPHESIAVPLQAVKESTDDKGNVKCPAPNIHEGNTLLVPSPAAEVVVDSLVDECQEAKSNHAHCDHCYSSAT